MALDVTMHTPLDIVSYGIKRLSMYYFARTSYMHIPIYLVSLLFAVPLIFLLHFFIFTFIYTCLNQVHNFIQITVTIQLLSIHVESSMSLHSSIHACMHGLGDIYIWRLSRSFSSIYILQ